MSTPWLPLVSLVKNGTDVSAEVVNPIFNQLVQREQYLFEQSAGFNDKSSLISFNVPVLDGSAAGVGSVVYFKQDNTRPGLDNASVAYKTGASIATPLAANNSYAYGIIKAIYTGSDSKQYADVYTQGRATVASVAGMMDAGQPFAIGPLYLSNTSAGKLTYTPTGLSTFIGYAISDTEIHLDPKVNEFSQLFNQYSFGLLDRPAGTPTLSGVTWTVSGDSSKVGWITAPTNAYGAVFFYNLPATSTILADTSLSSSEQADAINLKSALPPTPTEFNFLYMNGVLQPQRVGSFATTGIYLVDSDGIWWFNNTDGGQPWASDIGSGWVPADWPTTKGSDYKRANLIFQFYKAAPQFRSSLVASLAPYKSISNDTSKALTFVSLPAGSPSTVGDLFAKLAIGLNSTTEPTVTATGVKSVTYNAATGNLDVTTSPIVTSVTGLGGITAVTDTTGAVTVSSQLNGLSGQILSIEPNGADLNSKGLTSFLSLQPATLGKTGLTGRFQLPAAIPSTDLKLVLYMFGDIGSATNAYFQFDYSSVGPNSVVSNAMTTIPSIAIAFPSTANTCFSPTSPYPFIIPASAISANNIVNFRLTRLPTAGYTGNVNIISISWSFA